MVITQQEHDERRKPKEPTEIPNDQKNIVKSSTLPGVTYTITKQDNELKCTCPQNTFRSVECKHIKQFKNGN